jgi:hypothetical protein
MDALSPQPARGRRTWVGFALVIVPGIAGAAPYRTANFDVQAPTPEAARAIGDRAEVCRQAVARAWLGRELPRWGSRCPIRVKLTGGEAGGVTHFDFGGGRVTHQDIEVEGRLDRVLASALPHEVTHTIFAAYFGGPMPRWADEGASLLSEDDREIHRHEAIVAGLLHRGGEFPLTQLFRMEQYPSDLMGFYGQGYSVSRFLVEMGGRPRFLRFVRDGGHAGWDAAARAHYHLTDCRELDRAWRSWQAVRTDLKPSSPELLVRAQSDDEAEGQ